MLDFIGKILFKRTPEPIQSDDPQSILDTSELSAGAPVFEDLAVANALVAHLNGIKDWKDRIDAIDYLSNEAAKAAGNPTYGTTDESLINAIKSIGGSGGAVDFELAKIAIAIVFDMYDVMALSAVTSMNNA